MVQNQITARTALPIPSRRRRRDRRSSVREAIAAIRTEHQVTETKAYAMYVQASVAA